MLRMYRLLHPFCTGLPASPCRTVSIVLLFHVSLFCCALVQAYVDAHPDEFLMPSGFVYHETRTGSTLVANMFAHVPTNLVMSENPMAESPIRSCSKCSTSQRTELLQLSLRLLGTTQEGHTHAFFKFSDATTVQHVRMMKISDQNTNKSGNKHLARGACDFRCIDMFLCRSMPSIYSFH